MLDEHYKSRQSEKPRVPGIHAQLKPKSAASQLGEDCEALARPLEGSEAFLFQGIRLPKIPFQAFFSQSLEAVNRKWGTSSRLSLTRNVSTAPSYNTARCFWLAAAVDVMSYYCGGSEEANLQAPRQKPQH